MMKHLNLDDNLFTIKSEEDLLGIFDALLSQGFEPFEAYNFISEKYGEEIISEILGDEISRLEFSDF